MFVPVIARDLLESIGLLTSACTVFADKCIAGIEANDGAAQGVRGVVAVDRHRAQPVHRVRGRGGDREGVGAHREVDPRRSCCARKLMTDDELDRALDVEAMTRGGIIG